VYISFYQINDQWLPVMQTSATVMVRTPLDISALMPAIRSAVYGPAGGQPIYDVHTMQQLVSGSMATQRFPMMLLAAFAALALLLASVGIYAVISYSVAGRVHEIGIRMALGAEKQWIFGMVIQQGLRLAAAGLAIGTIAAFLLSQLLRSFSHLLYGVNPSDPLTFAGVALLLSAVAVFACYVPARRATRVDPMIALRSE
jgi:putative ABC transport system permease protein